MGNKTSIMDNSAYRDCCLTCAKSDHAFLQFRREHMILDGIDTVDPEFGQRYANAIEVYYPHLLPSLSEMRKNDGIGNPYLVDYPKLGVFCPTTLRYIKTYGDLLDRFNSLEDKHVVEIGGGYGGLCRIVSSQSRVKRYTIIDLPEALALAKRYLEALDIHHVDYLEPDAVPSELSCDLVVSNYAFSECERSVQKAYLDRVIRHSQGGYMVYNFIGHVYNVSPWNGREWGEQLRECGFEVASEPESPGPKDFSNLLFTWKRV